MLLATVKGMLGNKLRLILTATSIALGVAFLAGTLMLTDSMQRAFDELFADASSGTDVTVRAETAVETQGATERPPLPSDLLAEVRQLPDVSAAEGSVEGYALLTDTDGKPIQPQGAPTIGASMPEPALLGEIDVRSGRAPEGPGEVAIDASSAEKGELAVGDSTRILFRNGPEEYTVVGIVGFGDADDLGGSTTAYFDLATAQQALGKEGVFFARAREIRVETRLPGLEFTADGEVIGDEPAEFSVIPHALKVVVGPEYVPEPREMMGA